MFGRVWRFEKFLAIILVNIIYLLDFYSLLSKIHCQIYETSLYCQTKDVVFILSPFRFVYLIQVSVESHREFTHFWRRPKMINCRVTFTLLFLCLYYIVHMLFAGFDVTYGMCIFDVIQSHKLTSDQTMQCVLSVQRSRQFYSSFHRVDISPRSFSQ